MTAYLKHMNIFFPLGWNSFTVWQHRQPNFPTNHLVNSGSLQHEKHKALTSTAIMELQTRICLFLQIFKYGFLLQYFSSDVILNHESQIVITPKDQTKTLKKDPIFHSKSCPYFPAFCVKQQSNENIM